MKYIKNKSYLYLEEQISFIIQGPVPQYNTNSWFKLKNNLLRLRNLFPKSEIILSTWYGSNTDNLFFHKLILNKDPMAFKVVSIWEDQVFELNINRQIVSTINGLKHSSRLYSVKIRTDNVLVNQNILYLIGKSINLKKSKLSLFNNHIITLPAINPFWGVRGGKNLLYRSNLLIPDWFFAGQTNDLIELWNVPLVSYENYNGQKVFNVNKITNFYSPEQYILYQLMNKNNIKIKILNSYEKLRKSIINESEFFLVSNFIFIPANILGLISDKYPNASYAAVPIFSQGLYTYKEWRFLYYKYISKEVFNFPNFFELLIYFVIKKSSDLLYFHFKWLYLILIKFKQFILLKKK
jgi:hypothetical protein